MGYRIVYSNTPPKRKLNGSLNFRVMVAGCLLLFAMSVRLWWPEGRAVMERFLLPVEVNDIQTVFAAMVEDIRGGERLSEAVGAFCREIIIDAETNQ